MRMMLLVSAAAAVLSLCGCAVVGAGASVAGAVISTGVEVTGDVVGGVVRTTTGGNRDDDRD
jgi:hypothetical protein